MLFSIRRIRHLEKGYIPYHNYYDIFSTEDKSTAYSAKAEKRYTQGIRSIGVRCYYNL